MKSVNLDYVVPLVIGAAWGAYIYKDQDHTPYNSPNQPWGWTKVANKVRDWFTTGKMGALIAIAASSYNLSSIDSLHSRTQNQWLNNGIRILSWFAFFYYSFPSNDPGYKALPAVFKTASKLRDFLGNFDGSITQAKCVKEIYSQPIVKNFITAPQDFLLPLAVGMVWGLILHDKQDSRFDPNNRFNNLTVRKLDEKLKNGNLGKVVSAISSSIGLFTIDQLSRPFFPKNLLGRILRFSPWAVYGLLSIPIQTDYVKAISQAAYGIFHTFRLTFFTIQTSLVFEEIKDIFRYGKMQDNLSSYIVPVTIGAIWEIIPGEKEAEVKQANSLLVKWITTPYRVGGNKLRTISRIAYQSLCFLMVYQLSTRLEAQTQKVFPKSEEERYDHLVNTWWNFLMFLGQENLLFKVIFNTLKSNFKFNFVLGEDKKFIKFINTWDILAKLKLVLDFRKDIEKMTELVYAPTQPKNPSTQFDFTKSNVAHIMMILLKWQLGL